MQCWRTASVPAATRSIALLVFFFSGNLLPMRPFLLKLLEVVFLVVRDLFGYINYICY